MIAKGTLLVYNHKRDRKEVSIMEYKCAKRLEHFTTGIFAALDEKKDKLVKEGRTIYNLSVGTPDFKPPKHIMDAVTEAVQDTDNYKYTFKKGKFQMLVTYSTDELDGKIKKTQLKTKKITVK